MCEYIYALEKLREGNSYRIAFNYNSRKSGNNSHERITKYHQSGEIMEKLQKIKDKLQIFTATKEKGYVAFKGVTVGLITFQKKL